MIEYVGGLCCLAIIVYALIVKKKLNDYRPNPYNDYKIYYDSVFKNYVCKYKKTKWWPFYVWHKNQLIDEFNDRKVTYIVHFQTYEECKNFLKEYYERQHQPKPKRYQLVNKNGQLIQHQQDE